MELEPTFKCAYLDLPVCRHGLRTSSAQEAPPKTAWNIGAPGVRGWIFVSNRNTYLVGRSARSGAMASPR